MKSRILLLATFSAALTVGSHAEELVVRTTAVGSFVQPDSSTETPATAARSRAHVSATDTVPPTLELYPVAGVPGEDLSIPYFVDLDPTAGIRDFNCGTRTFGTHNGHDAYLRGFTEQDIGVPVFAVADGVVEDLRDGQPDHNTGNDPTAPANYIVIEHGGEWETTYVHLRNGSLLVKKGDHVVAGQQIALIGSSGMSVGPHIHFQLTNGDVAFEPMAGPCRLGASYFRDQPEVPDTPVALGASFSNAAYNSASLAPFDNAPHLGTYVAGTNEIYLRTDIANLPAAATYGLLLTAPNGATSAGQSTISAPKGVALASLWSTIDAPFNQVGTWMLSVYVNNDKVADLPFNIVASSAQLVNHAPRMATAAIEPADLRAGGVAVCRATGDLFLDPDYDIVRYHYVWTVDGVTVRDVTTAARSDALARNYVRGGSVVGCSITTSDATLSGPTSTAFENVVNASRRRAVGH